MRLFPGVQRTTVLCRGAGRRPVCNDVKAFDCSARAAQAGDPEAQAAVAEAYLHGIGVPPHRGEAARWFGRAAAQGHVVSMVTLAKLALASEVPDYATALRWATRAAASGSLDAKLLLANLLLFGAAEHRDVVRSTTLFREAAAQGSAAGSLGLALALLQGEAVVPSEVIVLIETAAATRLPMALYLAGIISECGLAAAPDLARVTGLYQQAALLGVRAAQTRFGAALLEGIGTAQDAMAGETWLRKAALAGDAAAAALVGQIYDGPAPNAVEAGLWFARAAALGGVQRVGSRQSLAPTDDPAFLLARCLSSSPVKNGGGGPNELQAGPPAALMKSTKARNGAGSNRRPG